MDTLTLNGRPGTAHQVKDTMGAGNPGHCMTILDMTQHFRCCISLSLATIDVCIQSHSAITSRSVAGLHDCLRLHRLAASVAAVTDQFSW